MTLFTENKIRLESIERAMNEIRHALKCHPVTKSTQSTAQQTDIEVPGGATDRKSYLAAAQSNQSNRNAKEITEKQTKSKQKEKENRTRKDDGNSNINDVSSKFKKPQANEKDQKTRHQISSHSEHLSHREPNNFPQPQAHNFENESKRKTPDNDDDKPKLLCIHDSMLKRVDPQRLGNSYGLSVARAPAYYVDKVESATKEQVQKLGEPEAILIHSGINNLKSEDPKQAAMNLVKAVKSIRSNTSKAKIIVSCVTTCNYTDLDHKKAIFNSVVTSELFNEDRIQVLQHRNFKPHHIREDKIHPDQRGSAILASNIGRVVHSLFYTVVNRKRNHRNPDYWNNHLEDY